MKGLDICVLVFYLELFKHVPSRIMLYFDLVFGNDGQSAQNLYIESHIRDY